MAVVGMHLQVGQMREAIAVLGFGAFHHVDQLVVLAELSDDRTFLQGMDALRQFLRADSQGARLVLVDIQAHLLDALVPVEINVPGVGVGAHHRSHLGGYGA